MCSEFAIKVENLSKCFLIYDSPRDRLKQFIVPKLKSSFGFISKNYFREFWAIKDVSFELKRGQTLGIIGRNGSGKSTLLHTICGTLTPTGGSIQTNGRIAALLELGSGFNPEFTGRENIYLNGRVLGLTKAEIDARFDDIAAFADIGEFIDQPVKTYSSGMYVRLAFAVIANVDADILVVDEALSVGDAIFTQKCMRYIRSFQERGTLIFVSHDMAAVLNLCKSAIWMSHGRLHMIGGSKAVAECYLQYTQQEIYGERAKLLTIDKGDDRSGADNDIEEQGSDINRSLISYDSKFSVTNNLEDATGWRSGGAEILEVQIQNLSGQNGSFLGGELVRLMIRAKANQDIESPILGFLVRDRLGQDLFGENTLSFTAFNPRSVNAGVEFSGEFEFRLPMLPNGRYAVMASIADGDQDNHVQHHWLHDALIFSVFSSKVRWGLVGVQFTKVNLKCVV